MRKVLLICTHFPPVASAGTRRPARFVKHMPKYGWEPIVLTICPDDPFLMYLGHVKHDISLKAPSMNSTKIYHTRTLDIYAPFMAIKSLKNIFSSSSQSGHSDALSSRNSTVKPSRMDTLIKQFMANYIEFPDPGITWFPFAVWKGYQVIRRHKIDLLYSTSPYNASHLVGLLLKYLTGKLWVAEFRDPWMYQYLYGETIQRPKILRQLDQWLEGTVIRSADCILNVTETMTSELATQYPRQKSKMHTIMNGFDQENHCSTMDGTVERFPKFTIVYTGAFISNFRDAPVALFQALRQLINQARICEDAIQLIILGRRHPKVRKFIEEFQLSKVVIEKDYVPHQIAIQYQQQADVLLLVTSNLRLVVTSKVFEYLAIGKPILALSYPDVEVTRVIQETNGGVVINPNDTQAIADTVYSLYQQYQHGGIHYQPNVNEIEKYEASNLTRSLGLLFDKIILESSLSK